MELPKVLSARKLLKQNKCPQCKVDINDTTNRLVEDSCGHKKCRSCFIADDQRCKSCFQETREVHARRKAFVLSPQGRGTEGRTVLTYLKHYRSRIPRPDKVQPYANVVAEGNEVVDVATELSTSTIERKVKKKRNKLTIPSFIKVSDGEPKYSCTICKKNFNARLHVRYHLYCGGLSKPFRCSVCCQEFVSKSHYECHVRNHEGVRPFGCKLCPKNFNQQGKLTRHMKVHSAVRPFVCSSCGKSFKCSDTLKSHNRLHTGERSHSCTECSRKFAELSNLKKHMVIHTGVKHFMCDECGKSFALKTTLNIHIRTHSRVRPHSCKTCVRSFSSLRDLKRHAATHLNFRPFLCPICKQAFRRRDNFDRHMKNTHPESRVSPTILVQESSPDILEGGGSPIRSGLQHDVLYESKAIQQIDILENKSPKPVESLNVNICETPTVMSIIATSDPNFCDVVRVNNEPHFDREPIINMASPKVASCCNATYQAVPVINRSNTAANAQDSRYNTPSIIKMVTKANATYEGANCVPTITRNSNAVTSPNVPTIVSPIPQSHVEASNSETTTEALPQKPTLRLYLSDLHWRKRTMELLNLRNKLKADSLVYDKSLEKVTDANEERNVLDDTPPTSLELGRSTQPYQEENGKHFSKQTLYKVSRSHGETQQMYLPHNRLRHRLPKSIEYRGDGVSNIHHTGENTRLITLANVAATHVQEISSQGNNVIVENRPEQATSTS